MLNSIFQVIEASVAGLGLAYVPEQLIRSHVDAGKLVEVLREWRQVYEGYHIYYSNRRKSPALGLLLEALRYAA